MFYTPKLNSQTWEMHSSDATSHLYSQPGDNNLIPLFIQLYLIY